MRLVLVLFGVALLLAVVWGRRKKAERGSKIAHPPTESPSVAMIACDRCGLYVAADAVIEHQGGRYCCAEHAQGIATSGQDQP